MRLLHGFGAPRWREAPYELTGLPALEAWLSCPGNFALGDLRESIDPSGRLQAPLNVISPQTSSGMTAQAYELLGVKVLANLERYLQEHA